MTRPEVIALVEAEVERAIILHPAWPRDRIHAAAIVQEECGEMVRAAVRNHYERGRISAIREEAIHTAATAVRLLMNLDKP